MTDYSMPSFSWFVRAIDLVVPMTVVGAMATARGMPLSDPMVMAISFVATFLLVLGGLMFLPDPTDAQTPKSAAIRLVSRVLLFAVGSVILFDGALLVMNS